MDVFLRPATATDSEFAYQTKKAAFRPYVEMVWGWDEAEQRQQHARRFTEQEFKVIQFSGAEVGIVAVTQEHDWVKVNQLFILPDYQNRGIGKACLVQIIKEADEKRLPIRLRVLKMNSRAIAFYCRQGFKNISDTDTHVVMERSLLNDDLL